MFYDHHESYIDIAKEFPKGFPFKVQKYMETKDILVGVEIVNRNMTLLMFNQ